MGKLTALAGACVLEGLISGLGHPPNAKATWCSQNGLGMSVFSRKKKEEGEWETPSALHLGLFNLEF